MSRIKLVQGDTRPPVYIQLTDPSGPLDVSNAEVHMKFRSSLNEDVLQDIIGVQLPGTLESDGTTVDLGQYPAAGSGGRVRFDFPLGSLDVAAGDYVGEIEVQYSGGGIMTPFPKLQFRLRADF